MRLWFVHLKFSPPSALRHLPSALLLLTLSACDPGPPPVYQLPGATNTAAASSATPRYTYEIVHTFPHDRGAFTEGLIYLDGYLLESTGLNGQSNLRKVELETGKVLKQTSLPAQYFGEGIAVFDGKIFQLTWTNQIGFVYDLQTFAQQMQFSYPGEGWALTTDGQSIIMSDGSDQLRFLDPVTLQLRRTIRVTDRGRPVSHLNELEYIKGEIFANVWSSDNVVRINPQTGQLTGIINFDDLLPSDERDSNTDVLNGIAYDAKGDRIFITGKCWPKLFEVRLKPVSQ